jgi:hypothetical protein
MAQQWPSGYRYLLRRKSESYPHRWMGVSAGEGHRIHSPNRGVPARVWRRDKHE